MAEDDSIAPIMAAAAGETVRLPVKMSSSRPILIPEQVVVASLPGIAIELVFLRNEMIVVAQNGIVSTTTENSSDIKLGAAEIHSQLTDIGHARMVPDHAIDTALNILQQAVRHQGVTADEIVARLQTKLSSDT